MQDTLGDVAYAVADLAYTMGGAFVSSSLGVSELLVGLLVGIGFLVSSLAGLVVRRDQQDWRGHRS